MAIHLLLNGNLGNQLFQLYAAYHLSYISGDKNIYICHSRVNFRKNHTNVLDTVILLNKFNVNVKYKRSLLLKFRIVKLFSTLAFPFFISDNCTFIKNGYLKKSNNYYLDGYFNNFIDFQNKLKKQTLLKFKSFFKSSILNNNRIDDLTLHIRGTDFVNLGWDSIAGIEYYKSAISKMEKLINSQKIINVVTDDIAYAKNLLNSLSKDYKFNFISNSPVEDFIFLRNSNFLISSPSTFAFWAIILGLNPSKRYIIPSMWSTNLKRLTPLPGEII